MNIYKHFGLEGYPSNLTLDHQLRVVKKDYEKDIDLEGTRFKLKNQIGFVELRQLRRSAANDNLFKLFFLHP